jgi:tight adherence protein C
MDLFVVGIAATFFLGFILVFLLLGRGSTVSTRLMEVTGRVRTSNPRAEVGQWQGLSADRLASVFAPARNFLGSTSNPEIAHRLVLAGYRKAAHADIFFGLRMLLPLLGGLGASFFFKQNLFFWVFACAAVGFLLPDLWLMRAVGRRQERIRLSLPDALDLLVICLEAGLGLDQALVRVGQELKIRHPELSKEFLLINLEQRAGQPRLEAWNNMAGRTGVESVRSFVHMLIQTERFGTPISKSLGAFADALRTKRRQQAEERAAKTTIKLVFPLVLFIFPSLFIVLLAPAIITIMQSLGKAFSGD